MSARAEAFEALTIAIDYIARAPAYSKAPHRPGCTGALVRSNHEIVHVDRTGRRGNGGVITHPYRCNAYDADGVRCPALVLLVEAAAAAIARQAEERR